MSKPQENRQIDISRARIQNKNRTVHISAPSMPQDRHPAAERRETAQRQDAARSGAPSASQNRTPAHRPAQHNQPHVPASNRTGTAPKQNKRKKRRNTKKIALTAVLSVLVLVVAIIGGVYLYADSMMNESDLGSLDKPAGNADESEQTIVPPDMKGVKNILVLGLDYDSDDPVERDKKHPNTDMIMYVRLDANTHSMKMIQFPRDIFVGEAGGKAGKINGILAQNVDKGNGLGAFRDYIESAFGLPVDNYVTIDIDGLKAVVDAFYGVEVYVPRDMRYYNEQTGALEGELLQGWRKLNGEQCEFFLRYRQGLPRADIDRLVMQRQFYAALFRRLKTATVGDIVNLLPVAEYYLRTDISTLELMSMAIEVSTMDGANISMGRIPVYASAQKYNGVYSPVVVAKPETAAFLNEHFRPEDHPITAADIGTPDWPTTGGPTEVAMSTMSEVSSEGADEQHNN